MRIERNEEGLKREQDLKMGKRKNQPMEGRSIFYELLANVHDTRHEGICTVNKASGCTRTVCTQRGQWGYSRQTTPPCATLVRVFEIPTVLT